MAKSSKYGKSYEHINVSNFSIFGKGIKKISGKMRKNDFFRNFETTVFSIDSKYKMHTAFRKTHDIHDLSGFI